MTVPYPVPVSSTRHSCGEVLLLDPNPWKRLPKGAKVSKKSIKLREGGPVFQVVPVN